MARDFHSGEKENRHTKTQADNLEKSPQQLSFDLAFPEDNEPEKARSEGKSGKKLPGEWAEKLPDKLLGKLGNMYELKHTAQPDDVHSELVEEPVVSKAVLPVIAVDPATQEWVENCFYRLSRSKFRSSFTLSRADLDYAVKKGPATIHQHARDFLTRRLAQAQPLNDGRQTPWKGHPVFTAQHATATCCRGCMHKWWGVKQGVPLTPAQIEHFSVLIMTWISAQVNDETMTQGRNEHQRATNTRGQ